MLSTGVQGNLKETTIKKSNQYNDKEESVYISDNGPGINSRNRSKIFDPFFSTKADDGRGLGLYIVKEILDEKGFGISTVNEMIFPGLLSGANFKITFLVILMNNHETNFNHR